MSRTGNLIWVHAGPMVQWLERLISRCDVCEQSAGLCRQESAHLGDIGEVQQPLALH